MHPVSQSDGVFVSTGRGTPSAVSTHACIYTYSPIFMYIYCVIYVSTAHSELPMTGPFPFQLLTDQWLC